MARIPRLYRVQVTQPDSKVRTLHYQTPEAAEFRKGVLEMENAGNIVTVTPSHPVTYPHPAGDATTFDIPDSLVDHLTVEAFVLELGILPGAVRAITFEDERISVEYQPDPTGKRAPKTWVVGYI